MGQMASAESAQGLDQHLGHQEHHYERRKSATASVTTSDTTSASASANPTNDPTNMLYANEPLAWAPPPVSTYLTRDHQLPATVFTDLPYAAAGFAQYEYMPSASAAAANSPSSTISAVSAASDILDEARDYYAPEIYELSSSHPDWASTSLSSPYAAHQQMSPDALLPTNCNAAVPFPPSNSYASYLASLKSFSATHLDNDAIAVADSAEQLLARFHAVKTPHAAVFDSSTLMPSTSASASTATIAITTPLHDASNRAYDDSNFAPQQGCAFPDLTLAARSANGYEIKEKQFCTYPDCGRYFKDLKAHVLTHQIERPEKCPVKSCEYHTKGFARKYDKNRHTLTHYKGTMVCGWCPQYGSAREKTFNRADVFKRHLTAVHGVVQAPSGAHKTKRTGYTGTTPATSDNGSIAQDGICSTCSQTFASSQDFYDHLDNCLLSTLHRDADIAFIDNSPVTKPVLDPRMYAGVKKNIRSGASANANANAPNNSTKQKRTRWRHMLMGEGKPLRQVT